MFVDPPYPSNTVRSRRTPYAQDYNDMLHEEIIDFALSAKSKLMLASYPNPLYDKLIDYGWIRIDKRKTISVGAITKNLINKRGRYNVRPNRIESLYLNYTINSKML